MRSQVLHFCHRFLEYYFIKDINSILFLIIINTRISLVQQEQKFFNRFFTVVLLNLVDFFTFILIVHFVILTQSESKLTHILKLFYKLLKNTDTTFRSGRHICLQIVSKPHYKVNTNIFSIYV